MTRIAVFILLAFSSVTLASENQERDAQSICEHIESSTYDATCEVDTFNHRVNVTIKHGINSRSLGKALGDSNTRNFRNTDWQLRISEPENRRPSKVYNLGDLH